MTDLLFSDCDSKSVEAEILSAYENISGQTLYPGDPVRLFLEALAYAIAIQNNVIDLAGRQNLLAFASGAHLDYIGMMVGTPRLGASFAQCEQAFYLKEPLAFSVSIPAGSRVTTGGGRSIFALAKNLAIPAGEIMASGTVVAQKAGAGANGLVPGQISLLIDPVAYIAKTANLTASLLGSDSETDDHYRERIRQAPEAFSCAGPVGAYRYYALAAHQDIAEVAIYSPVPGTVDVRPVMKGGELPNQEILDVVRAKLNADNIRPLTDTVIVQAPELVEYAIDFVWYLDSGNEAMLSTITSRVLEAVETYRQWQRQKPGRDILPLKLQALCERAGARRMEIVSPQFQALDGWQLAREVAVRVVYGGVEE